MVGLSDHALFAARSVEQVDALALLTVDSFALCARAVRRDEAAIPLTAVRTTGASRWCLRRGDCRPGTIDFGSPQPRYGPSWRTVLCDSWASPVRQAFVMWQA